MMHEKTLSEETTQEKAAREEFIARNARMMIRAGCQCRVESAEKCARKRKTCGCACHPPSDVKRPEPDRGAKPIDLEDYRRLAPALAAHEAEWISAGKLRECIARWLAGADFTDPAQREWEGHHPEQTAKEELLEALQIAMDEWADWRKQAGAELEETPRPNWDKCRKVLDREKL